MMNFSSKLTFIKKFLFQPKYILVLNISMWNKWIEFGKKSTILIKKNKIIFTFLLKTFLSVQWMSFIIIIFQFSEEKKRIQLSQIGPTVP